MVRRIFAIGSFVLVIGGAMVFPVNDSDAGTCGTSRTATSGCGWTKPSAWVKCDDSGLTSHNHHHHHGHDYAKPAGRTACDRSRPGAAPNVSVSASSSGGVSSRERIAWREVPLRSGAAVINAVSGSSSGGVNTGGAPAGGGGGGGGGM